jgi:hypothetical protein
VTTVGGIVGGLVAFAITLVIGEWLWVDTFSDFSESFLGVVTFVLVIAAGVFLGSRLAKRLALRSRPSAN